jgi:hypothetical protein
MLLQRWTATALALAVLTMTCVVSARLAHADSRDMLIQKFTPLAGSEANAKILIGGLQAGQEFSLEGTTFKTPTGKLGNGELNIALSLTEAKLRRDGVLHPTSEQLNGALIGNASRPGILALRAEGKGWGQIAQTVGVRPADVMRAEQARRERHERAQLVRDERPERAERPEKPERPQKPERPERPERPEKPERPGR